MIEVGDAVKWLCPLDADYSYGKVLDIKRSVATAVICKGYHRGVITEVHTRYMEKLRRGGGDYGGRKRHSKRSITKTKL